MTGRVGSARRAAAGRRGVSLFLALVVVATLSLMATVALRISSDEVDIAARDMDAAQAIVAAETGIGHGAAAVAANPAFTGEIAGTVETTLDPSVTDPEERYALYVVKVLDESGDGVPDAVVSTATWRGQRRALRAALASVSPVAFAGKPKEINP